jgi:small subunit ribosomal protein S15
MLDKKAKDKIIVKYRTHEKDTGSPQVQVAILTAEIADLSSHLKVHKKDFSSRRGLLKKVNERRSLLRYIERENQEAFADLVKRLKLKIAKRITDEEVLTPAAAKKEALAATRRRTANFKVNPAKA